MKKKTASRYPHRGSDDFREQNTRFEYMYRDADNFKVSASVVFVGECDLALRDRIINAAIDPDPDGYGSFIPGQVGLPDLQNRFSDAGFPPCWNRDRDHPFHEILDIRLTDEAPTDSRVIGAFANAMEAAKWDHDYLPPFYDEMLANQRIRELVALGGASPGSTIVHDFTLTFSVGGSRHNAGADISAAEILSAMKKRIAEIEEASEKDPDQLRAIIGFPVSSHKETGWVLRQIGRPGIIRQADGGWIQANMRSLRSDDVLSHDAASWMSPGADGFWCRSDIFESHEVLASIHSDDRVIDTVCDIRPWLAAAAIDDIRALQADGWGYSYSADHVANFLHGSNDPQVKRLFDYLHLNPSMANGDPVGFGLSVDEDDVRKWLETFRPETSRKIFADEGPSP